MNEIKLKVEGMTCGHCQMSVKKALENIKGVKSAVVDLEKKSAEVNYKSDKVTVESLVQAVENAGY
ncbi:MAG: heavy-metal-associated domain-containing protein, partial [Candidatus Heimdallarchaeota archaeon]|nr:heavy-metal-associated domain-containing protein [Candidatus Heimdallarchaeota archaeon]